MPSTPLLGCLLLLATIPVMSQTFVVATVGDSFADSLYNSLRARPDWIERDHLKLLRWSRPIVGLTRTDVFDYAKWLRETRELGFADVCFVEIGANDMQSISINHQWISYGSPEWKKTYAERTLQMAQTLIAQRCGRVLWVLQPGFEKRGELSCHRELINELQRETLRLDRTGLIEIVTSAEAYGSDQTHFNREFLLQLGAPLLQMVDTTRQFVRRQCNACHTSIGLVSTTEVFPLRWWKRSEPPPVTVWKPDHTGARCQVAVVKRLPAKGRHRLAAVRRTRAT
jgi:hypothetical protein